MTPDPWPATENEGGDSTTTRPAQTMADDDPWVRPPSPLPLRHVSDLALHAQGLIKNGVKPHTGVGSGGGDKTWTWSRPLTVLVYMATTMCRVLDFPKELKDSELAMVLLAAPPATATSPPCVPLLAAQPASARQQGKILKGLTGRACYLNHNGNAQSGLNRRYAKYPHDSWWATGKHARGGHPDQYHFITGSDLTTFGWGATTTAATC